MTLKTKDILKILKLVKKSKKAKKRRSKHKRKINITTQQITPSTLQPYEISRQPFNNTNNVQLENLRLNNQVLENKLKEPDSNIKAIEDKLNLAIGYNNINDKVNLTTSSISDIKNDNMDLNNKLNRVIDFGQNFVAETNRKFNDHQLKQDVQQPVIDSNEVEDQQPEVKTNEANEKPDDNFVYKKIRNDKIVRALLKQIETKPSRKLSEEEKNVLKPFYKKYNVPWASNTQSTSGVKKQLQKFIL